MIVRLLILLGVLLFLSACTTHYRNSLHPEYGQSDLDRDWYECQKENSAPSAYVNPYYGAAAGTTVNYDMASACLAARGWRPANAGMPNSQPDSSPAPKLRKKSDPACESGMYWDSSKGACVKVGG
jgi:hypothetical protein